jgi:hypothetical protein
MNRLSLTALSLALLAMIASAGCKKHQVAQEPMLKHDYARQLEPGQRSAEALFPIRQLRFEVLARQPPPLPRREVGGGVGYPQVAGGNAFENEVWNCSSAK